MSAQRFDDPLEPQVRHLFTDLRHAGKGTAVQSAAEPHNVRRVEGEAGREQRGTRVRFVLTLRESRLVEARYHAYGCPHTLAVCEWLACRLEADGAQSIGSPEDWCRALGVPIVKLGRLLIVEDAVRAALAQIPVASAQVAENVVK